MLREEDRIFMNPVQTEEILMLDTSQISQYNSEV